MEVSAFPAGWNISQPEFLADTPTSRVWKVRREDGAFAVVKDLKPVGIKDEFSGVSLLKWRRGKGYVKLLDQDGYRLLLEFAGERSLHDLLNEDGDTAATETAAELLNVMHAPSRRPLPQALQPLGRRFRSLFRRAEQDRMRGRQSLYVAAAESAELLLSKQRDICPLHGDFHHANVLLGSRGWLAIDPKGLIGDPCFDAANLFYNPQMRDDLCLDPDRIASMARILSRALGRDVGAILDYAIVYGYLSAAWHNEDGNTQCELSGLSIAHAITGVRKQSG